MSKARNHIDALSQGCYTCPSCNLYIFVWDDLKHDGSYDATNELLLCGVKFDFVDTTTGYIYKTVECESTGKYKGYVIFEDTPSAKMKLVVSSSNAESVVQSACIPYIYPTYNSNNIFDTTKCHGDINRNVGYFLDPEPFLLSWKVAPGLYPILVNNIIVTYPVRYDTTSQYCSSYQNHYYNWCMMIDNSSYVEQSCGTWCMHDWNMFNTSTYYGIFQYYNCLICNNYCIDPGPCLTAGNSCFINEYINVTSSEKLQGMGRVNVAFRVWNQYASRFKLIYHASGILETKYNSLLSGHKFYNSYIYTMGSAGASCSFIPYYYNCEWFYWGGSLTMDYGSQVLGRYKQLIFYDYGITHDFTISFEGRSPFATGTGTYTGYYFNADVWFDMQYDPARSKNVCYANYPSIQKVA